MKSLAHSARCLSLLPSPGCLKSLTRCLRKHLGRQLARQFSLPAPLLKRALDDAEELALETGFPHLFLPLLAEEKVRVVAGYLEASASIGGGRRLENAA